MTTTTRKRFDETPAPEPEPRCITFNRPGCDGTPEPGERLCAPCRWYYLGSPQAHSRCPRCGEKLVSTLAHTLGHCRDCEERKRDRALSSRLRERKGNA